MLFSNNDCLKWKNQNLFFHDHYSHYSEDVFLCDNYSIVLAILASDWLICPCSRPLIGCSGFIGPCLCPPDTRHQPPAPVIRDQWSVLVSTSRISGPDVSSLDQMPGASWQTSVIITPVLRRRRYNLHKTFLANIKVWKEGLKFNLFVRMQTLGMLTVLWHLLSLSNSNIQFNDQGPGGSHRGEPFDRNLLKNILSHPSGDKIIQKTGRAFYQKL